MALVIFRRCRSYEVKTESTARS